MPSQPNAGLGPVIPAQALQEVAMLKLSLLPVALWATGQAAWAAPQLGAGAEIQQIPPAPTPERAIPDVRVQRGTPAQRLGPVGAKIVVQSLHVAGETQYRERDLIAATGFIP